MMEWKTGCDRFVGGGVFLAGHGLIFEQEHCINFSSKSDAEKQCVSPTRLRPSPTSFLSCHTLNTWVGLTRVILSTVPGV